MRTGQTGQIVQSVHPRWIVAVVLGICLLAIGWIIPMASPAHATTQISEVELTDITAPVLGGTPQKITDGNLVQDNVTINTENSITGWHYYNQSEGLWHELKESKFKAGELYSIKVFIKAKEGYEFKSAPLIMVNGDSFNVVDVKNYTNEISFRYIFPLTYIATQKQVDVYSTDSIYSSPLGILKFGDVVQSVSSTDSLWMKIDYNGQAGWVQRNNLAIAFSKETACLTICKVMAGAVNVRSEMSLSSKRITELSGDREFLTTGVLSDGAGTLWYALDINGQLGFIMAKYLDGVMPLTELRIQDLPKYITSKTGAEPATASGDEAALKDRNIDDGSNGELEITIMPDSGTSFMYLDFDTIVLPLDATYVLKDYTFDTKDGSLMIRIQNNWTYITGKTLKVQNPTLTAGKKQATVKWKKDESAKGYQIRYAYKADMSGAKTKTIKSKKTVSTTLKNLKKGKKVYVQVIGYTEYNGFKYYGLIGQTESVKVK